MFDFDVNFHRLVVIVIGVVDVVVVLIWKQVQTHNKGMLASWKASSIARHDT